MSLRTTAENVAWRRCIRDVACSSVVRYSRHRGCIDQKSSATDSQQPCAMENQWQRWRWAKLTSSVLSLVDWWWWSREFDSHHCASHSRTCSFINKQFNLVGGKQAHHAMHCPLLLHFVWYLADGVGDQPLLYLWENVRKISFLLCLNRWGE